ncbi:MAG TPA: enoyl-CoA hydratase/isomerase family protein [Candidatus Limnocylindrales bacterium]|nr:enoyl-CoA hydratase/isomerase family protein [Candidatus Limnocylindrales bacterium]
MARSSLGLAVEVEDGVGWVTLDRPPVNILDTALLVGLADTVEDLGGQSDLRLIVLRGEGRVFSAGVDVGEHLGDGLAPMLEAFHRAATRISGSDVPTLALVHGAALGGALELVALADLAIVAADAELGLPEIRLGCVPPVAAAVFPRRVGFQRAAALILTGETISGAEAERIGLVWKSVPAERLLDEGRAVADRFRGLSASALRLARRTLRGAARLPQQQAIADATDLQARTIPDMADAQEGLRSFLEKRRPVWSHR